MVSGRRTRLTPPPPPPTHPRPPTLPGNEFHDRWDKRLKFGLSLFVRFPPPVALALMLYAARFSVEYGPALFRSFISPLFGEMSPTRLGRESARGVYVSGDMGAKREALKMIAEGGKEGSLPSPQVAELGENRTEV